MPIKPENKARYPKNWKALRTSILERAGHCCEECGVENYEIGWRLKDGGFEKPFDIYAVAEAYDYALQTKKPAICPNTGARVIKIILTIAHLDHTPEHCDPSNLKALCQRCHLRYDSKHHVETARETRIAKRAAKDKAAGQGLMFQ